jgi:hypothetical protein
MENTEDNHIIAAMVAILGTMVALIVGLMTLQTTPAAKDTESSFLASQQQQPSKYAY